MAKFIYRMQNILNIKLKLEDQARMEYGLAQAALVEEEEKMEQLQLRRRGYEELAREGLQGSVRPMEMRENKEALLRMDEYIMEQLQEIEKAQRKVEVQRRKLQDAIQERKIHEKLRENAFEAFLLEEKANESREIDELTSFTYGQKTDED